MLEFRFFLQSALFILITLLLAPLYIVILIACFPVRFSIGPRLVQLYSRACLLIFRVKVVRVKHFGEFLKIRGGTLIIANHASFLDIFVLSAVFGTSFVSKEEVKRYPLIGQVAWLMGVLFFDRNSRRERLQIIRRLARTGTRRVIAVFPQGTTGSIRERLPFHRGIFKVIEQNPAVSLLPVTLRYKEDDAIAWVRPQTLVENARRVSSQGGVRVKLYVHQAVGADDYRERSVADICRGAEQAVLALLDKPFGEL